MNIITPIEQFRQLKEILHRQPAQVIIVGMDVAKFNSITCIADGQKTIINKKINISNTALGLQRLKEQIMIIKNADQKKHVVIGLEPTGNYHKPIANYFLKQHFQVVGISTVTAHENRKTLDGRWKKNDPKDAYNIVDLISQNKCFFYQQDDYYESLRCLVLLRNRLSKELSSIKIRLRNNHLAKYFPEMDALYKDILHPEALSVFQNFPTANDIASTSFDKFKESLNYKHSSIKAINRIKHLWGLANDSIGCQRSLSCDLNLQLLLEDAQRVQSRIKRIDHEIKNQCSSLEDYSLLQTIPGYGPWVAACFIAYFGNIDNYVHHRQLTKYAGIDLEYSQSGKFHSRAMISKKGNTILRYAICTAALRSMRNPFIRSYCQEKLLSKGETAVTKAKLRIKLADKFLRAAFVILKERKPFDIQLFVNPVIN